MTMPIRRLLRLSVLIIVVSLSTHFATAAVITFSGLHGGDNTPFTTYAEAGFTVAPLTSDWFQDDSIYGNPPPSIYDGPIGSPGLATIKITGTGDFMWRSVDYSSNNGPSAYSISGFLGAVQQFSEAGTLTAVFSPFGFTTLNGTHPGTLIDTLDITVNPSIAGVPGPSSINLDNVVVAPVPEPGDLLLLGTGLLALIRFRKAALRC